MVKTDEKTSVSSGDVRPLPAERPDAASTRADCDGMETAAGLLWSLSDGQNNTTQTNKAKTNAAIHIFVLRMLMESTGFNQCLR